MNNDTLGGGRSEFTAEEDEDPQFELLAFMSHEMLTEAW